MRSGFDFMNCTSTLRTGTGHQVCYTDELLAIQHRWSRFLGTLSREMPRTTEDPELDDDGAEDEGEVNRAADSGCVEEYCNDHATVV